MSATNHTQNYDLSQFVGGDIPSWLGDYNGDMGKIDTAIATVASGAGDTASEVNSLKSRMTAAEADIDADESNIATLQSTASTQGAAITQNTNNITTANNNISALDTRVTALENASGSGLDLSSFGGDATVTATLGSIVTTGASTDVKYALNSDKTIGKVFGAISMENVVIANEGWNEIAEISSSDLPTRTEAATIYLGFIMCVVSSAVRIKAVRLALKTNGKIGVELYSTTQTVNEIYINLPPCLYLLSEGI